MKFSIGGIAKVGFDSKLFKKTETNQSEITVKVDREIYDYTIMP